MTSEFAQTAILVLILSIILILSFIALQQFRIDLMRRIYERRHTEIQHLDDPYLRAQLLAYFEDEIDLLPERIADYRLWTYKQVFRRPLNAPDLTF